MIRVTIQQPSLAQYRVPVFRELAHRPGIDLTVVYGARKGIPNVAPDGFKGIAWPLRMVSIGNSPLFFHRPQWSFATSKRSDVLVLTWNIRYVSLVPGLLQAQAKGVPTILWGHGISKREKHLKAKARRWATSRAAALLFYNRAAARAYRESGVPQQKLFVALNSLDQAPIQAAKNHWESQPQHLAAFQRQNEIHGVPLVLYVSRLDPNNRIDLLIEAVSLLKSQNRLVRVAIVGSGDDQLSKLQTLARQRGVDGEIRFLGAMYDEMELAPWFLSAQVFCYPENIGLSLLHAFGYGVPVVTSDHIPSQNPEIEALRNNENGLLYRHRDVQHLAQCLWKLICEHETREALSREAVMTVEREFNLQNMVDGMEAAIRFCAENVQANGQ